MSPINKKERDYKMTKTDLTIPKEAAEIILHAVEGMKLANNFPLFSNKVGVWGDFERAVHRGVHIFFGPDLSDEFMRHLSSTSEIPTWFTYGIRGSEPFTLNVLSTNEGVTTETFALAKDAIDLAKEEVKWESTIHATVTDERSGEDIFDQAGEQI